MQGHKDVVAALNTALTGQLTAINQYFLHARTCRYWGFAGLNASIYAMSITAMKHADALIERILFLEGLPNLQKLGKLTIGERPAEVLSADLQLAHALRTDLLAGIATGEHHRNYISRDLLRRQLDDWEAHIDWLETQQHIIDDMGLENYLQSQLTEGASDHAG